jgi:zinc-ribbon domain
MWAGRPTRGARDGSLGPCRPARAAPYVRLMKIRFTKAPTFTKAIIASAVFAIAYLASTSNLPSCSATAAVLSSGGECIERQSFLHTASGWLALICLVAAVLLLALKHKDSILGRQAPAQQAYEGPSAQAPVPTPVPGRASSFCPKCGTRIIAGDRFCQGCGASMGSL